MLTKRIVALASVALTLATPLRRPNGRSCAATTNPTLPLNGGDNELPQPEEGEVLKYILLGHGIQNYTCTTPGEEAKASGAVAVLYDATAYFPLQGRRSVATEAHFNALTTLALWANGLPLNGDGTTQFGAAAEYPFPAAAPGLELPGVRMPFVGHHFFDAAGVPVFHSGDSEADSDLVFRAQLVDKVPAPTRSDPGPVGTGAVAWLHLADNGDSRGVSRVYRVVTAGGSPRECVDGLSQSVPYATYYWLYGRED
ncbi:hypothetical protein SODALDRAFT_198071 [Sodiomyces alkalinus F11]|uniref:Malate dehydrogenase n=1 Tax=Sodiomyces alkalinus (strain CBS 110278 / VKM F-3762 / F11) TaxID=1314773 RepID=A0A3N2PSJ2_SODAK|nr:hypothetical protein SODALDRAFT_198071 [Sodiomyces alkalinus F11]ROT37475.1 hypothetical protein SODALDRAFT_198071 [Sodiomyces alkalinus F11]